MLAAVRFLADSRTDLSRRGERVAANLRRLAGDGCRLSPPRITKAIKVTRLGPSVATGSGQHGKPAPDGTARRSGPQQHGGRAPSKEGHGREESPGPPENELGGSAVNAPAPREVPTNPTIPPAGPPTHAPPPDAAAPGEAAGSGP
jgi:hypothetical protein